MDYDTVSKQFLMQYYGSMMGDRKDIMGFYSDASIMTYGGHIYRGLKQISDKIESFSFKNINYQIENQDVQEGPIPGNFLIFVSGALVMDQTDHFKFSQVFNICPNGQGGLYCHNDIFTIVM